MTPLVRATLAFAAGTLVGLRTPLPSVVLLVGTGFAGDYRLHNGAHDTRHAMGFPCH